MSDDFKIAFSKLDIDNKRNELNNEMRFAFGILKAIRAGLNMDPGLPDIKNYDINKDANMNESQLLDFMYEDVYNLQKEIMDVAEVVCKKSE